MHRIAPSFRPLAAPLVLAALATLAACGGGGAEAPRVPAQLQVVSGDVQQGEVDLELAAPLVVRVVDAGGAPIAGQLVNFRVVAGSGSAFAGSSLTNQDGVARERWRLGTATGAQRLEARAVDANTGAAIVFATFTATAVAGPAASVTAAAGTAQAAQQFTALPVSLRVHVADRFGNPVAGAPVAFTPASRCGEVSPPVATTGASGDATATWTVGATLGEETVAASVADLPPATFSATVSAGPLLATLSIVSGAGQAGVVGVALAQPVVVRLAKLDGSPLPGQPVAFSADASGHPSSPVVATDDDGRAEVSWTMGPGAVLQRLEARAVDPISGLDIPAAFLEVTPDHAPAAGIEVLGGAGQSGEQRFPLAQPLLVKVVDVFGNPIPGAEVTFVATSGGGTATPATVTAGADGTASTTWKLGAAVGAQALEARVSGARPASFSAIATEGQPFDGFYVGSFTVTVDDPGNVSLYSETISLQVRQGQIRSPGRDDAEAGTWYGTVDPVSGAADFSFRGDSTTWMWGSGTFTLDGAGGAAGAGPYTWWSYAGTWTLTRLP